MRKLNLLCLSAALLAATSSAWGASTPVLYGYQGDAFGNAARGMYSFTPTGTTADILWRDALSYNPDNSISSVNMISGWMRNGKLCGYMSYYPIPSNTYYKYVERDLETGNVTLIKDIDLTNNWTNFFLYSTYCPADDRIYGYGFNPKRTGFVFKSAPASDMEQAVIIKTIRNSSNMCGSMCYNEELGMLVGIAANENGCKLYKIDPNTGDQELLCEPELDIPADYTITAGLAWLPASQTYLWNFYTVNSDSNVSMLVEINPTTGATNKLRNFNDTYNFNYFVLKGGEATPNPAAPEMATDIKIEVTPGSNKATFTFKMPSKLQGGGALTGNVDYTIYVTGVAKATGTGAAGAVVTTEVELNNGINYVRVVPAVGNNTGMAEVRSIYVGNDTPQRPGNVRFEGTTLRWDAVTMGIYGGELSDVTYEVTLNGKLVEEGTTATSMDLSDAMDPNDPQESFQAEVVAISKGTRSEPTYSERIVVGKAYTVPFTVEPTESQFLLCIQEDTDKNKEGWTFDTREYDEQPVLTSGFGKNIASEDWLFLPKFTAPANKIISFSCNVNMGAENLPNGTVEVWVGTAPKSSEMKRCIIPTCAISNFEPIEISGYFIADGELADAPELYIGIGVKSAEGILSPLQFETLKASVFTENLNGPAGVTNLKAVPVKDKPRMAHVTFILPDKTLTGEQIPATHRVSATVKVAGGTSEEISGNPGEEVSVDIMGGQGDFLITVIPQSGGNTGMPVNVVPSLGYGIPGTIRNLVATYDEDNVKLRLDWEAPLTDVNGVPCADDTFSYNIWAYDATAGGYVVAVNVPYPLTYATMDMTGTTTLQTLNVGITAVNGAGEGAMTLILCEVGTPHKLPIADDFNGNTLAYETFSWINAGEYANTDLSWGPTTNLPTEMQDSKVGDVIAIKPLVAGAKSKLMIPKVSTLGTQAVQLNLHMWTGNNAATTKVYGDAYPEIRNVEIAQIKSGNGYENVIIDLPSDFANTGWISLSIESEYPTLASRMVLAGYSVSAPLGVDGVSKTLFGTVRGGEGSILFNGYEGETANIYTADGRLVSTHKLASAADAVEIESGLYIVKVGNQTVKVIVR